MTHRKLPKAWSFVVSADQTHVILVARMLGLSDGNIDSKPDFRQSG